MLKIVMVKTMLKDEKVWGWKEEWQKTPLPKICHTYPTMMKLGTVIPYLEKIYKIYESRYASLEI